MVVIHLPHLFENRENDLVISRSELNNFYASDTNDTTRTCHSFMLIQHIKVDDRTLPCISFMLMQHIKVNSQKQTAVFLVLTE